MERRKKVKVTVEEILEAVERLNQESLLRRMLEWYNYSRVGLEPKVCDHEVWEKRYPTLEDDICSALRVLCPSPDNYNPNPPRVEDYKLHIYMTVERAKIFYTEMLIAWHRHKKTLIEPNP